MKIEELRIGMKVQELSTITKRLSPVMIVTGLFKGHRPAYDAVYAELEGGHEGDPFEYHPSDLIEVKNEG